jgi:hypothetical protein
VASSSSPSPAAANNDINGPNFLQNNAGYLVQTSCVKYPGTSPSPAGAGAADGREMMRRNVMAVAGNGPGGRHRGIRGHSSRRRSRRHSTSSTESSCRASSPEDDPSSECPSMRIVYHIRGSVMSFTDNNQIVYVTGPNFINLNCLK